MLKLFFILAPILAVVLMGGAVAFAGDLPRMRPTMDFGWRFLLGDPPSAQRADFDDSAWRPVDLPHDWSIFGSFDETAPAGGGGAISPPASVGIERPSAFPMITKIKIARSESNSTVSTKTATFGSTAIGSANAPSDTSAFLIISRHI